jgi:hypothetical protein
MTSRILFDPPSVRPIVVCAAIGLAACVPALLVAWPDKPGTAMVASTMSQGALAPVPMPMPDPRVDAPPAMTAHGANAEVTGRRETGRPWLASTLDAIASPEAARSGGAPAQDVLSFGGQPLDASRAATDPDSAPDRARAYVPSPY